MPTARVFGFVAAEADVCVLLRRGPSRQVLMVRWDLATDEFEIGQWLFATVRPERCGLSYDGKLFAYFAMDWRDKEGRGTYVALSCPPFFTASCVWDGVGTHLGGAWWEGARDLALDVWDLGPVAGSVPSALRIRKVTHETTPWWSRPPEIASVGLSVVGPLLVTSSGRYLLDALTLDADWADVDHHGRLLLAREGRILVRDKDGERDLIDLNPFEFRPLAPPRWATEWPDEDRR